MFNSCGNASNDRKNFEELIHRYWPTQHIEANVAEESEWEILNDVSESNRHWFKQNYLPIQSAERSVITYH